LKGKRFTEVVRTEDAEEETAVTSDDKPQTPATEDKMCAGHI
jgi:hypothetical protein